MSFFRRLGAGTIAGSLLVAVACSSLTENDDGEWCRRLNALGTETPDTLLVGETKAYSATGMLPSGSGRCGGALKTGFVYATDAPSVATVDAQTGVVTANGPGTTLLTATRTYDGRRYTGARFLVVVAPTSGDFEHHIR